MRRVHPSNESRTFVSLNVILAQLLRKFNDLMLVTPLTDDGEDCPICQQALQLKNVRDKENTINISLFSGLRYDLFSDSLVNTSFVGLSKGADETIGCPLCRQRCPRSELELVHYTSTQQCALLNVAKGYPVVCL
jgi:hypothetical protein